MNFLKTGVILALVGVLVCIPVFAFVSPGAPTGFVNDFAQILPSDTIAEIGADLLNFEQTYSAEIVVVTVPDLGGDTIENYAVELFGDWGIGKKGEDNGVLLLVAPTERKVRIEVGYGFEGELTDLVSDSIIRHNIIPAFKENDFIGGITSGVEGIKQVVQGNYIEPISGADTELPTDKIQILFFLFFAIIWLGTAILRSLGSSKAIWPGGLLGAIFGTAAGILLSLGMAIAVLTFVFAAVGILIDWFLSRSHFGQLFVAWLVKQHKNSRKRSGPGGGLFGGFGGGGGGGFGGFGGGGSGGGGSSGSW